MRFHSNKQGIRVLAIAESFDRHDKNSILAGIVMRRDLAIDGIIFSDTVVGGNNGTEKVLSMISSLGRNDISCILLGGLVISVFNIINGKHISEITGLPVMAISYKKSLGLKQSIHGINEKQKIRDYLQLGEREPVKLWTGKTIFVRHWGLTLDDASGLLNSLVFQGARPEPLRIATLAARACRNYLNYYNGNIDTCYIDKT